MPLLDHFHPPLSVNRHWHAFHNAWATFLSSNLNSRLPEHYFAEPNVQFGIEIDVATWKEADSAIVESAAVGGETAVQSWTPPEPVLTIPFPLVTDSVEVSIYDGRTGPTLVGAIDLVSPANKDRPEHREAFVSKCETYLQQGLGLVVVDVVTDRQANLHSELLTRLDRNGLSAITDPLYASAYRPVDREGNPSLDVWLQSLAVGNALPTIPLWLRGAICVPVELEASYDRTCREQRMDT